MLLHVNTFFNRVSLEQRQVGYSDADLAGKPTIRAPKFGKWLAMRRGETRSLESVAIDVRRRLEPLGVKFNRSQLKRIEDQGQVPHVLVLYALAASYRVSADTLVNLIAGELGVAEKTPTVPGEALLSERAERLARWFDALPTSRQDAILESHAVPDASTVEPARKERARGQPSGRKQAGR
jgi:hypothetical protein